MIFCMYRKNEKHWSLWYSRKKTWWKTGWFTSRAQATQPQPLLLLLLLLPQLLLLLLLLLYCCCCCCCCCFRYDALLLQLLLLLAIIVAAATSDTYEYPNGIFYFQPQKKVHVEHKSVPSPTAVVVLLLLLLLLLMMFSASKKGCCLHDAPCSLCVLNFCRYVP